MVGGRRFSPLAVPSFVTSLYVLLVGTAAGEQRLASLLTNSSGVSKTAQDRIATVISYMQDLRDTIVDQERKEALNYNSLMDWCAKEIKTTNQELAQAEAALEDKGATLKEVDADIAKYSQTIADNKKERGEVNDAIDQAKSIREEESGKYDQDKKLNDQSVRQVKAAVKIVGEVHEGGFLQNGVAKKLHINEPGESNYVLGIMKQLSDRLVSTGMELKKTEEEKQSEYKSFMDLKTRQAKLLHKDTVERQLKLNEEKVDKAELENEMEEISEEMKKQKAQLAEDVGHCQKKKEEWQVRSKDRSREKATLREAMEFLNKTQLDGLNDDGFLQVEAVKEEEPTSSPAEPAVAAAEVETADEQPLSFLQIKGKTPATAPAGGSDITALLAEVETRSHKQSFQEARQVVKDLIVSLQDQQKDETAKKEYCEKALSTKEDNLAASNDELEQLTATAKQKQAKVDTLTQEVAELETQIEQARSSLADAADIRKKEKKVYDDGTKDRNLAIKVMVKAQKVMTEFYRTQDNTEQHHDQLPTPSEGPAMPRKGGRVPKSWSGTTRHELQGNNIVELMAKIADDIRLEQKDADMAEGEASSAYKTLAEETRQQSEERTQGIRDRVTLRAKLRVQVADLTDRAEATQDDIDNLNKQLSALHEECDQLLQNFEQREKARGFEIGQLRDTRDLLAGASEATRTAPA
mmetsp:Transcript_67016/g.160614  ORF Transcript_67016/g.160614 Transcript_67016/m.160614 type:complete len:694 (+) Transcript_67016:152-2233(+)